MSRSFASGLSSSASKLEKTWRLMLLLLDDGVDTSGHNGDCMKDAKRLSIVIMKFNTC